MLALNVSTEQLGVNSYTLPFVVRSAVELATFVFNETVP